MRSAAQLGGQDFVLADCQGCTFFLLGHIGALRMLRLDNCTVVAGPVAGSCIMDHIRSCRLMLASYQVQMHGNAVEAHPCAQRLHGFSSVQWPPGVARAHAACSQVRIHRAHETDFYLRVRSRPIIEHSDAVRFAPFPTPPQHVQVRAGPMPPCDQVVLAAACSRLHAAQALFDQHLLGEESGQWQCVDDFGWIKAVQSPHWSRVPEELRQPLPELGAAVG